MDRSARKARQSIRWAGLAACLLIGQAAVTRGQEQVSATDLWEEIAPGVHVALQPHAGRFNDSNSAAVVTDREVIVVDAPSDERRARELAEALSNLTDKPVRWLVYTHWHTDHTATAQVWREVHPELQVVGHDSVREDLRTRAAPQIAEQIERLDEQIPLAEEALARGQGLAGQDLDQEQQRAQRRAIDAARVQLESLRRTTLLAPDLTYSDRLVLARPNGDVVLMHFEAHTRGDTVLWLPRQRVLVTGDLLDELPYGGHGFPRSWLAALHTLQTLEAETVVPGHGPLQRDRQRLDLAIELWSTLLEDLGRSRSRGRSLQEAREALDLADLRQRFCRDDPVAERNWDGFTPESVDRVWADLEGELGPEP